MRSLGRWLVGALASAMIAGCALSSKPLSVPSTPIVGGSGPTAVWGAPLGGKSPKGLLMLIHGGGWSGLNRTALNSMISVSLLFRYFGYETVSVDYRRGAQGIGDVDRFYREARQRVGAHLPICAIGTSAGGNIALMLAVRHPDLRCVIDTAGPTDLAAMAHEPGGSRAYRIAVNIFGRRRLGAFSPALHAGAIRAKLLLVYAQTDPLVPVDQGYVMARADPAAHLIVLPPGPATFAHTLNGGSNSPSGVSAAAKHQANVAEINFLDQATSAKQ